MKDKPTRCGDVVEVDENVKIFDKLQKQELIRLQRKYRQLGGDGPGGSDPLDKLGRQRDMARRLEFEKENLRTDLTIANSQKNKKLAILSADQVEHICQNYDLYRHDMEDELDEVYDIEHQLDKIIKRIVQQKLKIQKAYDQTMSYDHLCKLIENAKTRLCVLTTSFNTRCYINHTMRAEINENLLIRTKFFYRQKWYRKAYSETKLKMNKVTESTTKRYDSRDDASMKTKMLIARNDRDSRQHVLEIKDLQRVLHQDEQNNKFIRIKNRTRQVIEPDWARRRRQFSNKFKYLDELLINYRRAFRDVLKMGRTKDLETMVSTYRTQEQKNFAHVKYLMDLYNEIMVLKTTLVQLKKDIEYHAHVFNVRKKAEKVVLAEAVANVGKKEKIRKTYHDEMKSSEVHMDNLVQAIQNVFDAAKCENASIIRLLGSRMGIKPSNILLCLNALEHQIDDLKYKKSILQVRKLMNEGKISKIPPSQAINLRTGFKQQSRGGPFKPKVVFTGLVGLNDDEDEEERLFSKRAYTREEMIDYCQSKIRAAGGLNTKYRGISADNSDDDLLESTTTVKKE